MKTIWAAVLALAFILCLTAGVLALRQSPAGSAPRAADAAPGRPEPVSADDLALRAAPAPSRDPNILQASYLLGTPQEKTKATDLSIRAVDGRPVLEGEQKVEIETYKHKVDLKVDVG